jgi:hypothetical protein
MGMDELTPATLQTISLMQKMATQLPDDFFMVAAVQELAGIVTRNAFSDDDYATLLGIGALMIREGKAEAVAGIHAALALHQARRPPQ